LHGQGKSPKHGILVNHELVMNAQFKEKGKVARVLADKIAIASKVDYFKGDFVGDKLITELEKRFK
jgi:nucleolar protein 56